MRKKPSELIDVSQLRIGMFVELGVGWLSHPFPSGSFKIEGPQQIEVIRSLGLKQVRYFPHLSDLSVLEVPESTDARMSAASEAARLSSPLFAEAIRIPSDEPAHAQRQKLLRDLEIQKHAQLLCERRFDEAVDGFRIAVDAIRHQPQLAREQCVSLVNGMVDQILVDDQESSIRLLSQVGGERLAAHSVNVAVISLLLGRAMGLKREALSELGLAAFLHDIGKSQLPDRIRWFDNHFSATEFKLYQDHVTQSVALGRQLGLSDGVLVAMGQHHEMTDGSGFPRKLKGDAMSLPARILAVVNRYDNLCNPLRPAAALTPHEALSFMFSHLKYRYDGMVLGAFIRMVGVHPPGSLVQLHDDRYAMVVGANASRPLKPRLLVHEPKVPRNEALIMDLEKVPEIGIKRGVKLANLPPESAIYLAPRQRVCYYFEQFERTPEAQAA